MFEPVIVTTRLISLTISQKLLYISHSKGPTPKPGHGELEKFHEKSV